MTTHRRIENPVSVSDVVDVYGPPDTPLPEDETIKAAHPTRTGRHDLYAEAMRLVGARPYARAAEVLGV